MAHTIPVRKIPFDFDQVKSPHWHPEQIEWSHMINGASLTMPYLEPFLNRTLREAAKLIDDPDLKADIEGFVRQEAQHFTNHRRYNEMLKRNGYEDLDAVEKTFEEDYEKLEQRSLEWRLAYSAGFETMTMGVTEWLVNDRASLFHNADPVVASLILWHMVEETEHKSVAYDVYQAVSGKYWMRLAGLVWGSLHVGLMTRRAYISMLKKDGRWGSFASRVRVWKKVGEFLWKAGGAMVRALSPNYHPDRVSDPKWVKQWADSYTDQGDDQLPLLDTSDRTMPPQFA